MHKNIIFTKFIAICLVATFNNNVFAKTKKPRPSREINLVINNSIVEGLDTRPIIQNGYTFVPARGVFEVLGAVVDWDQKTHEVFIAYKDSIIELEINKKFAQIDNKIVHMDIPAKIINNRTMIPVRFIAESLGFKVNWDEKTKTVNILSDDKENNFDINKNNKNSSKNTNDNQSLKVGVYSNIDDNQSLKIDNYSKNIDDNQSLKIDNYSKNTDDNQSLKVDNDSKNTDNNQKVKIYSYSKNADDNKKVKVYSYSKNADDNKKVKVYSYSKDTKDNQKAKVDSNNKDINNQNVKEDDDDKNVSVYILLF